MPAKPKNDSPLKCTACNHKIKSAFHAEIHPLLLCLVCRNCRASYGAGDFSTIKDGLDAAGEDNLCRWCVDGGNLYACGRANDSERCTYCYCEDCLIRNCPDDEVLKGHGLPPDYKWICPVCDPSKLKTLRRKASKGILALSQKDLRRTSQLNGIAIRDSSLIESSGSATKKRKTDAAQGEVEKLGQGLSTEVGKPKRSSSIGAEKPKQNSSTEVEKPKQGLPSEVEKPKQRLPSEVEKPKQRLPSEVEKPKQRLPSEVEKPKQSLPSEVEKLKQSLPSEVEKPKQSLPSEVEKPKQSPSSAVIKPRQSFSTEVEKPKQPKTSLRQLSSSSVTKLRPISKQLKASNEQITQTTKNVLDDAELRKRLDNYLKVKKNCISEIDAKFQKILDMFLNKQLKEKFVIQGAIHDLEKPLQEFNTMLLKLKSLYHTQN